jgi:hypothetical protein
MPKLQITRLEIQGFRSFGPKPQTLLFPSPIAAVRAPNSHGKTGLAEAFEFLLTGRIVRRELLASSQDEFAGALRNAHIPAGTAVFVRAEVVAPDGKTHTIKRTLTADYAKRDDCRSALEIDGKPAVEQALLSLGFVLSQPPLGAPVLTQHTLGYLFSARPQDRATYFKAVLEVTDLESFRAAVAALDGNLAVPAAPMLDKLDAAAAVQGMSPHLAPLKAKVPTIPEIDKAVAAALAALITASGGSPRPQWQSASRKWKKSSPTSERRRFPSGASTSSRSGRGPSRAPLRWEHMSPSARRSMRIRGASRRFSSRRSRCRP